jgi:hypothetical protein
MPRRTKAETTILTRVLQSTVQGQAIYETDLNNSKALDKLYNEGLVRWRVELTDEGGQVAHALIHPEGDGVA